MKRNKIYSLVGVLTAVVTAILVSCSTGQRIFRAEETDIANLRHPFKTEKKQKENADSTKYAGNKTVVTYDKISEDGKYTEAELDKETGEYVTSMTIGEVTVMAKSATIPERNGKINIDFIIKVPQKLLQPDWRMVILPQLINGEQVMHLDSIEIKGEINDAYFTRLASYKERKSKHWTEVTPRLVGRIGGGYTNKERLADVQQARKHHQDVLDENYREKTGFRLDTVMTVEKDYYYYYSQTFATGDFDRKLLLYFDAYISNCKITEFGEVKDVARMYELRPSDTLSYVIRSLLGYVDLEPRYVRKTILKHVTDSTVADIVFRLGRYEIIDTLANNAAELERIGKKIYEMSMNYEFAIDSISLTAYSSPEGSVSHNNNLAKKRGKAIRDYLAPLVQEVVYNPKDFFRERNASENWHDLIAAIKRDSVIRRKVSILEAIEAEPNLDKREMNIRKQFPDDYKYIKEYIYPCLRKVNFEFHLSRRNMVEEEMVTDVVDTLYANAVQLLQKRKYLDALYVLQEHDDWNAALCYMSMGYDQKAWKIFEREPESAPKYYLMAILASRMGNKDQAYELFKNSCRLDQTNIYRGELDPEIAELMKHYPAIRPEDFDEEVPAEQPGEGEPSKGEVTTSDDNSQNQQ